MITNSDAVPETVQVSTAFSPASIQMFMKHKQYNGLKINKTNKNKQLHVGRSTAVNYNENCIPSTLFKITQCKIIIMKATRKGRVLQTEKYFTCTTFISKSLIVSAA